MTSSFWRNRSLVRRVSKGKRVGFVLLVLASAGAFGIPANSVFAQPVKIVGIGATSCEGFITEITGRPDIEKNYFAWAQGYMNGLLVGASADTELDLAPPTFPLLKQAEFLRSYCLEHVDQNFINAVNTLYVILHKPPG